MALLKLGRLVATPAAVEFIGKHSVDVRALLARHAGGDWGDLSESDVAANVQALQHDLRVFSSYMFAGEKLWIITEADRSSTCILLPEDY